MTLVWGPKDTSTVRPVTDTITVRCPHNGHYQRSDFSPHKTYPCMSYVDDSQQQPSPGSSSGSESAEDKTRFRPY